MRGAIGRIASSNNSNFTTQALISSSQFSTFAAGGGGGGRGRGRGGGFTPQAPGKPYPQGEPESDAAPTIPSGVGHGRGKPIASNPILPSFSSPWMSGINTSVGRGRTTQPPLPISREPEPPQPQSGSSDQPKKPIFFRREDMPESMQKPQFRNLDRNPEEGILPSSLLSSSLPGAGRGKPVKLSGSDEKPAERPAEVNRHIQRRPERVPLRRMDAPDRSSQGQSSVNREEAAKKAIGVLSRDGGRGRGGGVRGGRGRGVGGRRGGRGGFRGRGGKESSNDFDDDSGLKLGNNADGERLAQRLGPEKMAKLTEAFDEMSYRVLPSPMDDAYLDALHTNNMIEYEPEYLVEFDNPDIDDKPPIPLRDALEKMKPFLMAYEGIKSQEEWEEIIEDLMERVPAMKELIDYYCGPDRVTAKQQQHELERVAKTIPDNVPSSVKRFTDRAVLSLQSNPGWGWDKKCQFMDKLAWEVSQQYK